MYLSYLRVQLENLRKSTYIVCNNDHSTLGYHDYGMTWCTPPPVASIRKTLDKKGNEEEGGEAYRTTKYHAVDVRLAWDCFCFAFLLFTFRLRFHHLSRRLFAQLTISKNESKFI